MSFLAPFFLIGGLSVVLPVIFHLIRRSARRKVPFSTLMFLEPTPPQITRRSRIEHWLLLLLRCLVILLLVTAFARPFLVETDTLNPDTEVTQLHCIVLDRSASMQRPQLWVQAKAQAQTHVNSSVEIEPTALFLFDSRPQIAVDFNEWQSTPVEGRKALFQSALEESIPSWRSTNLAEALLFAHDMAQDFKNSLEQENESVHVRMTIISDFQEGSETQALQSLAWNQDVSVKLVFVEPTKPGNTSLQSLPFLEEKADENTTLKARLLVRNTVDSEKSIFRIRISNQENIPPLEIHLPPGQNRTVLLDVPQTVDPISIELEGDEQGFDNLQHLIPPRNFNETILFSEETEAENTQGLLFYFEKALPQSGRRTFTTRSIEDEWGDSMPALCVVASPNTPSDRLLDYLDQKGTVLVVLQSSEMVTWLEAFAEVDLLHSGESETERFHLLSQIDFQHPIFKPFADARFNNFASIHFWQYRKLNLMNVKEAKILATFDSGEPALWELSRRKGQLLVLNTSWTPIDSQLARSTKFAPLIMSILNYAQVEDASTLNFVTDDVFPASLPNGEVLRKVITPDGVEQQINLESPEQMVPEKPGIYELISDNNSYKAAVNLPWKESLTRSLPEDDLRALGIPGLSTTATSQKLNGAENRTLSNSEAEARQKWWRWALIAVFVCLFLEIFIAAYSANKSSTPHPQTT